ncbi:hypothetical protein F5B20DRAFT_535351 [Whalleya microplaca]|nr:hypothetical protein F5B20DRAFT_535351 [Whalleya microplaca]
MSVVTGDEDTSINIHQHTPKASPSPPCSLSDTSTAVQDTSDPPTSPTRQGSVTPATSDTATENVPTLRQDYVIQHMFTGLKVAWREIIERRAMILGSPAAFNTRFEPNIGHIRDKAMLPSATLQDIANATESAMIELWKESCKRVIKQYSLAMKQDLVFLWLKKQI